MKTDFNSNDCKWKHMAKILSDNIRLDESVDPKMADYTIDDITELAIYDAETA